MKTEHKWHQPLLRVVTWGHACTNSVWTSCAVEDLEEIYNLSFNTDIVRFFDSVSYFPIIHHEMGF